MKIQRNTLIFLYALGRFRTDSESTGSTNNTSSIQLDIRRVDGESTKELRNNNVFYVSGHFWIF